jgi:hypothetical protein
MMGSDITRYGFQFASISIVHAVSLLLSTIVEDGPGKTINSDNFAAGLVCLILTLIFMLATLYLLLRLDVGDFPSTQAMFFGIDGSLDETLAEIERTIFGFNLQILKWTTNGSVLSRHNLSRGGECETLEPLGCMLGREVVTEDHSDEENIYLIDTYTFTASSMFDIPHCRIYLGPRRGNAASRSVLIRLAEGSFCTETVVRMDTEKMRRVDRFLFTFTRRNDTTGSSMSTTWPMKLEVQTR